MSGWTEERDSELKRLCAQGLSFAQVGAAMGLTRNAALGRARRIGVSNGIPRNHWGRQNGGRPKKIMAVNIAAPLELPPIPDPEPSERVKMLDLQSHHCRFPFGDPQQEDFGFCGRQKAPGKSFCPTHAARCYQAGSAIAPQPERSRATAETESDSTPDLVADIADEKAQAA